MPPSSPLPPGTTCASQVTTDPECPLEEWQNRELRAGAEGALHSITILGQIDQETGPARGIIKLRIWEKRVYQAPRHPHAEGKVLSTGALLFCSLHHLSYFS